MITNAGYAGTWNKTGTTNPRSALLSILSYFAREVICSPARIVRVLWRMATNIPMQFRVFELLKIRAIAGFVCSNPRFLFKYLPPRYLARDLPAPTRTACFLHHYRSLHRVLSDSLLRRVLQGDVALFQMREGDHLFEITMGRSRHIANSRHVDHEGELSLNLLVDGAHVFILSFTIVPGWVVESDSPDVLMISRIQGGLDVFQKIQLASRAMLGIPPEMLLLAVLQGVGEAFGIRQMAGVSAFRHICYCHEDDAIFKRAYDELFTRIGATRNAIGYFVASFPLLEKPMSEVKRGQKTRSRARRALRRQMAIDAFEYLRRPGSATVCTFSFAAEDDDRESPDTKPGEAVVLQS
jgi:uncharacterized protein VirK/YbjX